MPRLDHSSPRAKIVRLEESAYRPPRWLSNRHSQLAWGALARPGSRVAFRRETLPTPDGDEIVLDHVVAATGPEPRPRPRLIALHGLEGSSFSPSVQGVLRLARERGWNATALNFRSCAREPTRRGRAIENRTARLYHSGETTDLDFVVRVLGRREPRAPLLAVGSSIGGNVLLKWLGEQGSDSPLVAAAALSTPYHLERCARNLETPLGRLYSAASLRTLRPKALSTASRFPAAARAMDLARIRASRTFFAFDDAATAPLHGFAGASDYYARSSSLGYLGRIRTPTLGISARNDPFLPEAVLDEARKAASPALRLWTPASGSHLAFPEGPPWALASWAEREIVAWLGERLG